PAAVAPTSWTLCVKVPAAVYTKRLSVGNRAFKATASDSSSRLLILASTSSILSRLAFCRPVGFVLSFTVTPNRQGGTSVPADDPLIYLSATTLARRIREKKISAKEAVTACLARIADVNPRLNAVVQLCAERAQRE